MRESEFDGLTKLRTGRGPLLGEVVVVDQAVDKSRPSDISCGLCIAKGAELEGGHSIVVDTHIGDGTWSKAYPDTHDGAVSCETVARMLEAMGSVTAAQLEGMGFSRAVWLRVNPTQLRKEQERKKKPETES